MVLFPQAEALILQLLHHSVEYTYNAVGFPLAYRCQPTTEILCLKQVHPAGNGVQGLDDLPVEINQVNQAEANYPFYQIKAPSVFLRGDVEYNHPQQRQQGGQNQEKGFQFHWLIL
jgi:hypothetical protein